MESNTNNNNQQQNTPLLAQQPPPPYAFAYPPVDGYQQQAPTPYQGQYNQSYATQPTYQAYPVGYQYQQPYVNQPYSPTAPASVVVVQEEDATNAILVFIAGFFIFCCWALGYKYRKSPNPTARALGNCSIVLFFLSACFFVIYMSIVLSECDDYGDCYN